MNIVKITTQEDLADINARIFAIKNAVIQLFKGGPVEVEIKRESKNRDQEKKYHALIQDITRSVKMDDRYYDFDYWKAVLVDDFEQEMKAAGTPLSKPGRVVMSRDGRRVVTVRPTTTKFRKQEAADFIEYLYATGSELGARWTDNSLNIYEQELQSRGLA